MNDVDNNDDDNDDNDDDGDKNDDGVMGVVLHRGAGARRNAVSTGIPTPTPTPTPTPDTVLELHRNPPATKLSKLRIPRYFARRSRALIFHRTLVWMLFHPFRVKMRRIHHTTEGGHPRRRELLPFILGEIQISKIWMSDDVVDSPGGYIPPPLGRITVEQFLHQIVAVVVVVVV